MIEGKNANKYNYTYLDRLINVSNLFQFFFLLELVRGNQSQSNRSLNLGRLEPCMLPAARAAYVPVGVKAAQTL